MGWTYGYESRKSLVEEVLRPWTPDSSGVRHTYTDLKATRYGRNQWFVIRHDDVPQAIGLLLIAGNGDYWGYKDMDESAGPCEVDCPLSLLDLVPCPDSQWAREWREKVKQHHVNRQRQDTIVKSLTTGDYVRLKPNTSLGDAIGFVRQTERNGKRQLLVQFGILGVYHIRPSQIGEVVPSVPLIFE